MYLLIIVDGREGRGKKKKERKTQREDEPESKGGNRNGWGNVNGRIPFHTVLIFKLGKEFAHLENKLNSWKQTLH